MDFYTEYDLRAAWKENGGKTFSVFTNALGNFLVNNCGFTLAQSADEDEISSSTNVTMVSKNGFDIIIYGYYGAQFYDTLLGVKYRHSNNPIYEYTTSFFIEGSESNYLEMHLKKFNTGLDTFLLKGDNSLFFSLYTCKLIGSMDNLDYNVIQNHEFALSNAPGYINMYYTTSDNKYLAYSGPEYMIAPLTLSRETGDDTINICLKSEDIFVSNKQISQGVVKFNNSYYWSNNHILYPINNT